MVERAGVGNVLVTPTLMKTPEEKTDLMSLVVEFALAFSETEKPPNDGRHSSSNHPNVHHLIDKLCVVDSNEITNAF